MIYLFDERGVCKLRSSGAMSIDTLLKNKEACGASYVIEHDELLEIDKCCLIDGKVVGRPPNPAIMDGMWVRRVPHKALLTIDDGVEKAVHQVTDNDVELEFVFPGTYEITVSKFPYLDITYKVTV